MSATVIAWIGVIVLAGCDSDGAPKRGEDRGPLSTVIGAPGEENADVVAVVGGVPVPASALRQAMVRTGGDAVARYDEIGEKRVILEDLVKSEVLAAEARRENLDREPDIEAAIKRLLADQYWERKIWDAPVSEVTDSEVRTYYDAHVREYSTAERVRGSVILLEWRTDASPDERRVVRERAARVLAEVKGAGKSFSQIAADESDDVVGRQRGGDIGWLPKGAVATYPPPEALRALYGLGEVGAVAEPVESAAGVYIVKLTDRLPPSTRPYEQVRDSIRAKLVSDRRTQAADERYRELRDKYAIEVREDVLARIGPPPSTVAGGPPSFPIGPGIKSP